MAYLGHLGVLTQFMVFVSIVVLTGMATFVLYKLSRLIDNVDASLTGPGSKGSGRSISGSNSSKQNNDG
ncbi:MAG: hypothetical protein CMH54_01825 [Myxococcales bacterium]|mgnify:CR=1 FL=1|nr:hypothetical protein [Myxococcales bacterium]